MFVEGDFFPPWFNPVMPPRERCVLACLLDAWASAAPDRVFAVFEDGEQWTFAQTRAQVLATAQALRQLGVRAGDPVGVWLPNGKTAFLVWFAANYLGAVFCPYNTSLRGNMLAHVLGNSGVSVLVCHAKLVARLQGLALSRLTTVVAVGDDAGPAPAGCRLLGAAALQGASQELDDAPMMQPWDTYGIIYTSGTTGPSKGVLISYLQLYTASGVGYGYMTADDRVLVNLPMCHVGGTNPIFAALMRGASFALVDGFDTKKFWHQIKSYHCTTSSGLIGSMTDFLEKAPVVEGERNHPLKLVGLAPVTQQTVALAQRYGFQYKTGFNMTEVSSPLVADINTRAFGSCGKPRDGIECRLVDEHDQPVAVGEVGELIVRADLPWVITTGYNGMPDATLKAWRNGWFHTGDLFRQDAEGNYFFVDRGKDAIRRRGENISSLEVESEVLTHPDVLEAAVVPAKLAGGEEEVLAVVAPRPGAVIDPAGLIHHLVSRLPHYMVPRFVRILPALPRTDTNKVRKFELREAGVTADTWDRERAGIAVKREKLTL